MSSFRRTILALAGLALFCLPAAAQPASGTNAPVTIKSPVALFRELLAMTPAERKAQIAIRPPEIQKRILEKLNEYEILPGDIRELRLQETELRWYLRPLMDEPKTNRAAMLARIPEPQRSQVEDRLRLWDLLPPGLQAQFKDNDMIANYFAQIESGNLEEQTNFLHTIPRERLVELQKGLDRWKSMSADERQRALAGFNQFFQLTPEEKQETLNTVSDGERQEMEKTLASYASLTPDQREQCIRSFQKFARMSIAERQQFLKNAERWSEMTPEERQKWRQLVSVAPIMPQQGESPAPGPSPHSFLRTDHALATN